MGDALPAATAPTPEGPPLSSSRADLSPLLASEMDAILHYTEEDSFPLWDWSDFVNFAGDAGDLPAPAISSAEKTTPSPDIDRLRKRDPRMSCSNFLAGRIPCACPELDEKADEEETPSRKRQKLKIARCQVTGCEADIGELKGYHRRHRVCLRCAGASVVLFDGLTKRYCQQCGRFHHLSDFDEDKRSCRRKLERHNNRRRRKLNDNGSLSKKETERATDGVMCDSDLLERDKPCFSGEVSGREVVLDFEDANHSKISSFPNSENIHSDMVTSFSDLPVEGGSGSSKSTISSVYYNKSTYTSAYPTGRMSFKLYDWNPAEFPRSLRHQIFQWLASMPVELEGYIRPGCTILTTFIAMARDSWDKVNEDLVSSIRVLAAPGGALSGKGMYLVHMNGFNIHVSTDGNHFSKSETSLRAPQLHCIFPLCFEAGKPMEFIVGGSNLCHTNARFLVSFAGKYLSNTSCFLGRGRIKEQHQLYKILIPSTDPLLSGPAFVEVENEFGLSAFLPVLIAHKEVCSEMSRLLPESLRFGGGGSCSWPLDQYPSMVSVSRKVSQLMLDVAWLIRAPLPEYSRDIGRFNCLTEFLLRSGCVRTVSRSHGGGGGLDNGSSSQVKKMFMDGAVRDPCREVVVRMEGADEQTHGGVSRRRWVGFRAVAVATLGVAVCFGMCATVLLPGPVGDFLVAVQMIPNCVRAVL